MIEAGNSYYRLWVDGAWTTADWIPQSVANGHEAFYRVQFTDRRVRQVKLGFHSRARVPFMPFYGVVLSGSDAISPTQTPLGPKTIIFGDSYTAPTIVDAALPQYQGQDGTDGSGYGQILGEYFNWNWMESGAGGTGFVTSNPTFLQREQTDVCNTNPEMVIVLGGGNDGFQPEASIQSAAIQFFSQLQACDSNAQPFLLGPQTNAPNVEPALTATAAQFGAWLPYKDMTAENWFYGTKTNPATGNEYLYWNAHPTPLGHDYLAEKIANFIITTFPSLTPQTFPLFSPAPAAGSYSYSAANSAFLPVGPQNISVTFTPQDNVNYATVTQDAVLIVTKASSSISVSSSVASIAPGKTITLAATVSPQIGGVPSGTVVFLDNGSPMGSSALDSTGSAVFNTDSLSVGTHLISASYPGDGNFYGSSSTSGISIVVAKPDFTMAVSTTSLTVVPGQSGTFTLTVTPVVSLSANLSLSCSGLPANASCSLQNKNQIAVNEQSATATVTIQAFAQKTALNNGISRFRDGIELCGLLGLFFVFRRKNRTALSRLAVSVLLLIAGISLMSGCGSNTKFHTAEPGTYNVAVILTSASDATLTHSQTIEVVIP